MAIYRSIHTTFWTDTKIVDDFTPEDKYFMLYCLTNSYTNLCGCYEISIKQMTRDLGYNEETVLNLLKRFSEVHKTIFYNKDNKELFIKNWFKYNWTKSNKLDKPLLTEIENIKTPDFKRVLVEEYNKRDTVSIPYTYTMDTTDTVTVSDIVSDTDIINNKLKRKRKFIPPTLEEIQEYIKDNELVVDAKKFYKYFTATNWVDSKGNKVNSWKGKLITWDKKSAPVKQDKFQNLREIWEES